MNTIRILLADDHKLIRGGLRLVIDQQPDLSVVGEADDGRQAVELTKSLKPKVVVMDIGMPNLNGIEAARQITAMHPDTAVIVLSMHSDVRLRAPRPRCRRARVLAEGLRHYRSCAGDSRRGGGKVILQPSRQQGAARGLRAETAAQRRGGFL